MPPAAGSLVDRDRLHRLRRLRRRPCPLPPRLADIAPPRARRDASPGDRLLSRRRRPRADAPALHPSAARRAAQAPQRHSPRRAFLRSRCHGPRRMGRAPGPALRRLWPRRRPDRLSLRRSSPPRQGLCLAFGRPARLGSVLRPGGPAAPPGHDLRSRRFLLRRSRAGRREPPLRFLTAKSARSCGASIPASPKPAHPRPNRCGPARTRILLPTRPFGPRPRLEREKGRAHHLGLDGRRPARGVGSVSEVVLAARCSCSGRRSWQYILGSRFWDSSSTGRPLRRIMERALPN